MRDLLVELKQLRLHGIAGTWADLAEQSANNAEEEITKTHVCPSRTSGRYYQDPLLSKLNYLTM